MDTTFSNDIDQLNKLLRGELSAVQTYRQCIESLDDDEPEALEASLEKLKRSHEQRAAWLKGQIRSLGGEPEVSSGVWGAFAMLYEGGATLFGDETAVSALADGEAHGKKLYQESLVNLTPHTRRFIEQTILPEQRGSYLAIDTLRAITN